MTSPTKLEPRKEVPSDRDFGDGVPGLIAEECYAVRDLLHEKNAKYGNSALDPKRIFSKAHPVEQIAVRIDDKLSRIATTGLAGTDEDTLLDLIGYLILLRVAWRIRKQELLADAERGDEQ